MLAMVSVRGDEELPRRNGKQSLSYKHNTRQEGRELVSGKRKVVNHLVSFFSASTEGSVLVVSSAFSPSAKASDASPD